MEEKLEKAKEMKRGQKTREEGKKGDRKGREKVEKKGEMMWIGNNSAHVLFKIGNNNGERK